MSSWNSFNSYAGCPKPFLKTRKAVTWKKCIVGCIIAFRFPQKWFQTHCNRRKFFQTRQHLKIITLLLSHLIPKFSFTQLYPLLSQEKAKNIICLAFISQWHFKVVQEIAERMVYKNLWLFLKTLWQFPLSASFQCTYNANETNINYGSDI